MFRQKILKSKEKRRCQSLSKKGYLIKEDRNGYWVFVKPAQVLVTLTNSNGSSVPFLKEP